MATQLATEQKAHSAGVVALFLVATSHTQPLRSDRARPGRHFPQRSHLCACAGSAVPSQQHLPACLQKMPLLICSDGVANWVIRKVLAACCRDPALPGSPPHPRLQARIPRELCLPLLPAQLPVPPTGPVCAIPRGAGPFSCLRLSLGSRNP